MRFKNRKIRQEASVGSLSANPTGLYGPGQNHLARQDDVELQWKD
jgi:hypothetical protein